MKPHPFMPLVFSLFFLGGGLAVRLIPPNSTLVDRPWLQKPTPLAILPPAPPMPEKAPLSRASLFVVLARTNALPTKGVFGAQLEASSIQNLTVWFQGVTNVASTNWFGLTNFPYPMAGGILYYTNAFTNYPALFVREVIAYPVPPRAAYSSYVPVSQWPK